ncbi:hypothetical protein ACG1BZ_12195 [Microbulbifer sp. CNSA002]|uniref:hypothetical protein n=1 Tax=unclassified Microbulbifer TaxID=2619833 RepID=UPI0039B4B122
MSFFSFKIPKLPTINKIQKTDVGESTSKISSSFQKTKMLAHMAYKASKYILSPQQENYKLSDTFEAQLPNSICKGEALTRPNWPNTPAKGQPHSVFQTIDQNCGLSDAEWIDNPELSQEEWIQNLVTYIKTDGAWAGKSGDLFPGLLSHFLKVPINVVCANMNTTQKFGNEYSNNDSQTINLLLKDDHFQLIENKTTDPKQLNQLFKSKSLQLVDVDADGNCLFSAVCKAREEPEDQVLKLRNGLGDWILQNMDHQGVRDLITFTRAI